MEVGDLVEVYYDKIQLFYSLVHTKNEPFIFLNVYAPSPYEDLRRFKLTEEGWTCVPEYMVDCTHYGIDNKWYPREEGWVEVKEGDGTRAITKVQRLDNNVLFLHGFNRAFFRKKGIWSDGRLTLGMIDSKKISIKVIK